MFPNLIIAGAPKCGTTSLYDYLTCHPEIGGSSVKETHYFMDRDYPLYNPCANYNDHALHQYEQYFEHLVEQHSTIVCEATPDYMYQASALKGIKDIPNDPLIVFMLRNPADRAYSLYRFAQNNIGVLPKEVSFSQFIDDLREDPNKYGDRLILKNTINHGYYAKFIEKWVEIYPGRVRLYLFEEMVSDPKTFMCRFAQTLGVDAKYWEFTSYGTKNPTVQVRSQRLQRLFRAARKIEWLRGIPASSYVAKYYRDRNMKAIGSKKSESDILKIKELNMLYQDDITRLEEEFLLDVSHWRSNHDAISTNT